jgi:hypothetical protein
MEGKRPAWVLELRMDGAIQCQQRAELELCAPCSWAGAASRSGTLQNCF